MEPRVSQITSSSFTLTTRWRQTNKCKALPNGTKPWEPSIVQTVALISRKTPSKLWLLKVLSLRQLAMHHSWTSSISHRVDSASLSLMNPLLELASPKSSNKWLWRKVSKNQWTLLPRMPSKRSWTFKAVSYLLRLSLHLPKIKCRTPKVPRLLSNRDLFCAMLRTLRLRKNRLRS